MMTKLTQTMAKLTPMMAKLTQINPNDGQMMRKSAQDEPNDEINQESLSLLAVSPFHDHKTFHPSISEELLKLLYPLSKLLIDLCICKCLWFCVHVLFF